LLFWAPNLTPHHLTQHKKCAFMILAKIG